MRRIWAALAILAAIFVGSVAHSVWLSSFTAGLTDSLASAEFEAEQGNWDRADRLTQKVRDQWEEKAVYLYITLRHDQVDAICTGIREVSEFIQCREQGEYSAANARLIVDLELLAGAERLTASNIL